MPLPAPDDAGELLRKVQQDIADLRGRYDLQLSVNQELRNRLALLEDEDDLPWPRPEPNTPALCDFCIIHGNKVTISGTRARFIEFALDGSYAQWTATPTFPWATDGSVGYYDTNNYYVQPFMWGN